MAAGCEQRVNEGSGGEWSPVGRAHSLSKGCTPRLVITVMLTVTGAAQEAAELIASRSCGEGWLLQPKVADMPEMEYRCTMLLSPSTCLVCNPARRMLQL